MQSESEEELDFYLVCKTNSAKHNKHVMYKKVSG